MTADAAALLWETTLATSAATLLVLSLRVPVRRAFGAGAAYGLRASRLAQCSACSRSSIRGAGVAA